MPTFLFTFHAYRSWMPDHPRGYTKRGVGYLAPDPTMQRAYERCATYLPTIFDHSLQRELVRHVLTIPNHIAVDIFAVATETSHIHILCGWSIDRSWESIRDSIKRSISIKLKQLATAEKPLFLSAGASRKQVLNQEHFDHLIHQYLPNHSGSAWYKHRGFVKPKK